ncbi:putative cation-transporting ATPase 13A3 [Alligator mississippiensis]|uniref:Cation-transporting ATPase 13A3 n=1 Tax=Alligator mississippiensis TaxID=8496 RepID=A0A151PJ23_ALLMI|nr:putative cation-transporting ATPase 13A3 [Alligator mississippiensis]
MRKMRWKWPDTAPAPGSWCWSLWGPCALMASSSSSTGCLSAVYAGLARGLGYCLLDDSDQVSFFIHHWARYLWDLADQAFHRLTALDAIVPCSTLHGAHSAGLPLPTQAYRRHFYGDNLIDVKVPSLLKLLLKEPSACFALHAMHKQYILLHNMVAAHNMVRVTVSRGHHAGESVPVTKTALPDPRQLVCSILYPKPTEFHLYCDARQGP